MESAECIPIPKKIAIDNEQNCWGFAWIDDNSDSAYLNMNPNHNKLVILKFSDFVMLFN
jgi:hypothetical protein